MALVRWSEVVGIMLPCLSALACLAALIYAAKRRQLGELSFPASLFAAKAVLLLLMSVPALLLDTAALVQMNVIWQGLSVIDTVLSLVLLVFLVSRGLFRRVLLVG